MRIVAITLTLLAAGCATPAGNSGKPLEAPYLHPTARLVFPEEILGIRVSDLRELGPRDISGNYRASGVALTGEMSGVCEDRREDFLAWTESMVETGAATEDLK